MIPCEFFKYAEERMKYLNDREQREQDRIGVLCATVANFAMKAKQTKTFQISDFFKEPPMTDEQMLEEVEKMNRMFGGEDKRKKRGE